jgi:hypothetical protein
MDWFERLTGFRETGYGETRAKLKVSDRRLTSLVNGRTYGIGQLELVSLRELRARVNSASGPSGLSKISVATGDVGQMHRIPENAGALFQVASQFNLLEMVSPSVSPEQGVTRYQNDRTQGPACAIACGAATIYRNYFVPIGEGEGETAARQFDGLNDIGDALSRALGVSVSTLWEMRNGYALCHLKGLEAITRHLGTLGSEELDQLRGRLRIGLHWDVEVTDATGGTRPTVSQAFCSALPVAYTNIAPQHWTAFASLVLEAAYEATILAAVLNARRGGSKIVLLTQLGGGAFGNRNEWIFAAIRRALEIASQFAIDVKLVSYGEPSQAIVQLSRDFG